MFEAQQLMTLPDGRRIAWRESGSGPPLVLLHGWAMSGAVFGPLAAALASDFRLYAPDLRGHGDSAPGTGFDLAALAGDLVLWRAALGIGSPPLLGWSLGGMVALHLAQQHPATVSRLILLASTPRFVCGDDWSHGLPDAQVRALGRSYRRDPVATRRDFFRLQFVAGERGADGAALEGAVPLPIPEAALGGLELLRAADLRGGLPAIAQPALILHGSGDPIVPVAAGRALAAALPHAEMIEFPGLGHAPHLSRPELCAAALRRVRP